MEEKKKEINFWPYAIVGMISTVIIVGIMTLKIAFSNPVQEENNYMMSYQELNGKYNEIYAKQQIFDKKFDIKLPAEPLKRGSNRLIVYVTDKNGAPVKNAKIKALVTRPDTTKYDVKFKNLQYENGKYVSKMFNVPKMGRWTINVRVTIGNYQGYKLVKTFVD